MLHRSIFFLKKKISHNCNCNLQRMYNFSGQTLKASNQIKWPIKIKCFCLKWMCVRFGFWYWVIHQISDFLYRNYKIGSSSHINIGLHRIYGIQFHSSLNCICWNLKSSFSLFMPGKWIWQSYLLYELCELQFTPSTDCMKVKCCNLEHCMYTAHFV